jgi:hypothetical protein
VKIPAPGGDDGGGGEATAGDGAGGFTRGMFVCMLRVVGSYTKINTTWFRKNLVIKPENAKKSKFVDEAFQGVLARRGVAQRSFRAGDQD